MDTKRSHMHMLSTNPDKEVYNVLGWEEVTLKITILPKEIYKFSVIPIILPMAGVPLVVQQKWTQLVSMRMQVWSLSLLSGLMIWHFSELCRSHGHVACRPTSDPALLCLGCRPVAATLIQPWSWEPPYATGGGVKRQKRPKKKKKRCSYSHTKSR